MKPKLPNLQFIGAAFARMSKREKMLLCVTAAAVVLIAVDRFIAGPLCDRLSWLDGQIADRESRIRKTMRILALKEQIRTESLKYTPYVNKIEFGDQEVSTLLKKIEAIANKTSMNILNIKPQGRKDFNSLKTYSVALSCEGAMAHLIQFMHALEGSSDLLVITRMQVAPKNKVSGTVSCSMTVQKVIMG